MRRRTLGAAAAASLVALSAQTAHATAPSPGAFAITPARSEVRGPAPAAAGPDTLVTNSSDTPLIVHVFAARLEQLDGSFAIAAPTAHLLSPGTAAFRLPPHNSHVEQITWERAPARRDTVAGVVYEATPASPSPGLRTVERLLSIDWAVSLIRPGDR